MKKTIAILLSAIMVMGILSACAGGGSKNPQNGDGKGQGEEIKGPEGDLSSIIDRIYEGKNPEIMVETMEVDLGDGDRLKYFTGLSSSDKVKEAAVSESMIGAQAYSLVVLRLNDSADAEAIAEEMKEGIDVRKWICVEADDLRVVACGDVVMLIMVSSALSDTVTADEIVDSFKDLCGGNLTVDLK